MKRFLAAVAVAPIAISSAAVAGPYINADIESDFHDGEYHMSQTGLHLGYKDVKGKLEYHIQGGPLITCLLYTSPSPRDRTRSRMPSSA